MCHELDDERDKDQEGSGSYDAKLMENTQSGGYTKTAAVRFQGRDGGSI